MTGYSGKPLVSKLGIRPGFRLAALGAPADYAALLASLPDGVALSWDMAAPPYDCIHLFATRYADMAGQLPAAQAAIVANGMIWVSWPKRAARVPTDITEDRIRDLALALGLVDIKVCAVDVTWSGLKLVIPVAARPADAHGSSRR